MKLMSSRNRTRSSKHGVRCCCDFAVAEIQEPFGHFNPRWKNTDHLRIVDRFGEVHQATAFRVELLARFDEAPNRSTHGGICFEVFPIEFRISTSDVQK